VAFPPSPVSDVRSRLSHDTVVGLFGQRGTAPSARQIAVFLTGHLETEAQTARGLATNLTVSKPAITRAPDRLVEWNFASHKIGVLDRRNIRVRHIHKGAAFLQELSDIMSEAPLADSMPIADSMKASDPAFPCSEVA
jgi:DNA-binding MarR family transcriptional regulator